MTAPLQDRHSERKYEEVGVIRAGLDGPSRRIIVQPQEQPAEQPHVEPETTPAETPDREKEPAGV